MKLIALISLFMLSGCATALSDYGNGCRDGIESIIMIGTKEEVNKICVELEHKFKIQKEERLNLNN